MEQDVKLLQNVKRLMIARYPRFAGEIAKANLQFKTDLPYHTAATDGKNIYFDPNFLASLSDDDKLFIIAHELMHVKFEHMYRIMDKNGQKRDPQVWNIATDAIINANLERDGFKIKEGYVNMPEALKYSAEEFYEKLLREKQEQQEKQEQSKNNGNQGQNEGQQSQDGQQQEQGAENGEQFADDHSLWEKTFEESQKQQEKGQPRKSQTSKNMEANGQASEPGEVHVDERAEFQENRTERRERAKRNMERMLNQELKKSGSGAEFGEIGEVKAIVDWKLLLRREVEKTEDIWSQRRSIAENNYAYRLEENDIEDEAITEVMIDTSGSVSDSLVINFLRQLKPLLKNSKLKAGCFDTRFYGFKEIKAEKDIKDFRIVGRGGTDFEEAVRNFTFKREVNKIVFTDGYDEMKLDDKKFADIIWIVYENKSFQPAVGKVIQISKSDLQNLSLKTQDCEFSD